MTLDMLLISLSLSFCSNRMGLLIVPISQEAGWLNYVIHVKFSKARKSSLHRLLSKWWLLIPPFLLPSQFLSLSLSLCLSLCLCLLEIQRAFLCTKPRLIPFLGQGLYASLNVSLPIKEMGFIMVVRMLSSYEWLVPRIMLAWLI